MSNLTISAQHLRIHLLRLKSSYEKRDSSHNDKINHFCLFNGSFPFGTSVMPVSFENKYYPDRNIWVVSIIPQEIRYDWSESEKIEIDSGLSIEQVVDYLGNNLEKPVYIYQEGMFYPIYKNDIVVLNDQMGYWIGFCIDDLSNRLTELNDEEPLDGKILEQVKYCVFIDKYQTKDGFRDYADIFDTPEHFYFKNLPSAKNFYNKQVASFMEKTIPSYETNYTEFSQTSLSWHGWKSYKVFIDRSPVSIVEHLKIKIESVIIKYETIDGGYELI